MKIKDNRIIKAFKYRIYPNKEQRIMIDKTIGSCRWVYNNALDTHLNNQTEYEKETILKLCYGEIDSLIKVEYNKGRPKLPDYNKIDRKSVV